MTNFQKDNEYSNWQSAISMLEIPFEEKKCWILLLLALKMRAKPNFLVFHLGLRQWPKVTKYWNSWFPDICHVIGNAYTQILSTLEGHNSKICPIWQLFKLFRRKKNGLILSCLSNFIAPRPSKSHYVLSEGTKWFSGHPTLIILFIPRPNHQKTALHRSLE